MKLLLLRIVLSVLGVLFCLNGTLTFVPTDKIATLAGWFVGSETAAELWPSGPVFAYIFRQCTVASLFMGALDLVIAANPKKYRLLIDLSIGGLLLAGTVNI